MPEIRLEHVTKRWGKFYAVDDLDLVIDNNDFVTLLGPSGCGKTTTLRMIAGLETPTSGRITIGDRVVFDSEKGINIPPNKRKVGFLFQNYALWPNMTVYQNISFGLTNVHEELEKIDFEARTSMDIIRVLGREKELAKQLSESRMEGGALDEKKALLRLIDTFTISMSTAKRILGAKDLKALKESAQKKLEERRQDAVSHGLKLDDKARFLSGSSVITETRKLSEEEIDLAVRRVSRLVKIGMFMDRYPAELSGGQQQRVAIARTLAPEPTVLFMDEPLSNLDAKLRLEMRYELQRLHVNTGSTFVYVTHDQMEAMTLATRICLMNNGVLQQYAAPLEVYNKPHNLFAADFVGNPSINFIDAQGEIQKDGKVRLSILDGRSAIFTPSVDVARWFDEHSKTQQSRLQAQKAVEEGKSHVEKSNKDEAFKYHIARVDETELAVQKQLDERRSFVLGVRPECLELDPASGIEGEIYGAMPTGMESTIKARVADYLLTGVIFGNSRFKIGSKISLGIGTDRIMLFDAVSQDFISLGSITL